MTGVHDMIMFMANVNAVLWIGKSTIHSSNNDGIIPTPEHYHTVS